MSRGVDMDVERRRRILDARAEQLARRSRDEARRDLAARVAVVAVEEQRYGIPVEGLRELVPTPPITALPGLPGWLLGVAQVRGELLGVVDLGKLLDHGTPAGKTMAVLESRAGTLALTVGAVIEFRDVYADELSSAVGRDAERPLSHTTRDLVRILDVERIAQLGDGSLASARAAQRGELPARSSPDNDVNVRRRDGGESSDEGGLATFDMHEDSVGEEE